MRKQFHTLCAFVGVGLAFLMLNLLMTSPALADDEDIAQGLLACYHPTGNFIRFGTRGEWSGAENFDAPFSEIYDITFSGRWTGNIYNLKVALLGRRHNGVRQFRGEILGDTALAPANPNCYSKYWTDAGQ